MSISGDVIEVKGPKGQLQVKILPGISAAVEDGRPQHHPRQRRAQTRSFPWAGSRAAGERCHRVFRRAGRRSSRLSASVTALRSKGKSVVFNLGYSHPIDFAVPDGIEIDVDAKANRVTVKGIDRQQVGQVAAEIRGLRPPEPYKGKGIRYADERVRTKAGKQGATV